MTAGRNPRRANVARNSIERQSFYRVSAFGTELECPFLGGRQRQHLMMIEDAASSGIDRAVERRHLHERGPFYQTTPM
jgi:hypothetical protein